MATKATTDSRPMTEEGDFLQIKSYDHVHFYVGNAKHAMYYWWKAFGFKPVAYSGLETGNRDFASYVLESGQARFVVSAPYSPSSPLASHHMVHGDGVKVIAQGVALYELAEALRLAALLLGPVIPRAAATIRAHLGLGEAPIGAWEEETRYGVLRPGTTVTAGAPLFPKRER